MQKPVRRVRTFGKYMKKGRLDQRNGYSCGSGKGRSKSSSSSSFGRDGSGRFTSGEGGSYRRDYKRSYLAEVITADEVMALIAKRDKNGKGGNSSG